MSSTSTWAEGNRPASSSAQASALPWTAHTITVGPDPEIVIASALDGNSSRSGSNTGESGPRNGWWSRSSNAARSRSTEPPASPAPSRTARDVVNAASACGTVSGRASARGGRCRRGHPERRRSGRAAATRRDGRRAAPRPNARTAHAPPSSAAARLSAWPSSSRPRSRSSSASRRSPERGAGGDEPERDDGRARPEAAVQRDPVREDEPAALDRREESRMPGRRGDRGRSADRQRPGRTPPPRFPRSPRARSRGRARLPAQSKPEPRLRGGRRRSDADRQRHDLPRCRRDGVRIRIDLDRAAGSSAPPSSDPSARGR